MIHHDNLDLIINEYYDEEMNSSKLLEYEARQSNSKYINDYTNEQCFEFFKISNSIKLTKNRLASFAQIEFEKFYKKNMKLFYTNPFFFKRFNKSTCGSFLNFGRNNSK